MIREIRSKLPSVGTTIFTVMSRLAADLGAINLSQGFPDFDCDPALVDAVARHMRAGRNQYAPMQGVPALREAIAAKYQGYYGRRYDPETEVTVTSGGTEGDLRRGRGRGPSGRRGHRARALLRLVRPGDRVERRRPGRRAAAYPDYAIDWAAVRAAVTPRTRLIILNSPHNPAGAVLGPDDIARAHARSSTEPGSAHPQRRGVRAHHLRRRAAREHGARIRRAGRAQLHRRVVRQDLSHDRLEDRLRGRAGGADGGVPEGAPVRDVLDEHAGAARAGGLPRDRRGLAELAPFFQPKRDLFLRLMAGVAIQAAAVPRQLLPADGLLGDHRRARCRLRDAADEGARRRVDSQLAFPPPSPAPSVLRFCFAKKDETLATRRRR